MGVFSTNDLPLNITDLRSKHVHSGMSDQPKQKNGVLSCMLSVWSLQLPFSWRQNLSFGIKRKV